MVRSTKEEIVAEGPKSGHLSAGFRVGDLIFTSGNVGRDLKTGNIPDTIEEQTKQTLENISSLLAKAGASMSDVVKTTVFLPDMGDYAKMNQVYVTYFDDPKPARSCVGAKLARPDLKVEIEAIAVSPRK
jgi:2-iminobutanoate/2-iminopropanoate deaminase